MTGRGAIRADLRAAIIEACQARGDSREHARACMAEALEEPPESWGWWRDYFRGEAQRWQAARGRTWKEKAA